MGHRFGFQVLLGLLMLAMLAGVGGYMYNLGVAHGLTDAGRALPAPGPGASMIPVWPRPGGFGFGFFPFFPLFPLLFIVFWVFAARSLFWRGAWGWGSGYGGVPPSFDEWHRRAHAQQEPPPSQPDR
jgi:hypothetical protein